MSTEKTKVKLPVMFWVLQSVTLFLILVLFVLFFGGKGSVADRVAGIPTTSPEIQSNQLDRIESYSSHNTSQVDYIREYLVGLKISR